MDTAKQRIEKILLCKSINAKQLSELCGYERPQVLYDILNEKTKSISNSISIKITSVFPEINRSWLLSGEGSMMLSDTQKSNVSNSDILENLTTTIRSQQDTITRLMNENEQLREELRKFYSAKLA